MNNAGILLIGHGTRDVVGTRQFFELEKHLAEHVFPRPVAAGLLEFRSPTIPEAWAKLSDAGVTHMHVAPLLLFAAGHAKQDIPEILRECQARKPAITYAQSRPLSRHAAIIELAMQRLRATLGSSRNSLERTALVMVGRGSHDPCAKADMRILTELVKARSCLTHVFTTFYAMTEPRLPDTLEKLANSGQFDTIIIQPHLLFEGRLNQAIMKQTREAEVKYPSIQWLISSYLGPDPMVAAAIAERTLLA